MSKKLLISALAICAGAITGCSSGSSSSSSNTDNSNPASIELTGGGVKGPMAGATVTAYTLHVTAVDLKGTILGEGATNESAAITDLSLPQDVSTPFLLEFTADADTVDITTNQAPVITTLRTVVTASMLSSGSPIYGTPLTTVAVDLAQKNADKNGGGYSGDANGTITTNEFTAALSIAATQVTSSLGFGMSTDVDIFTTSPLINDETTTSDQQTDVAAYRTSVEALTAIVHQLQQTAVAENSSTSVTSDGLLSALAEDMSDGIIDGQAEGSPVTAMGEVTDNVASIVVTDPSTLVIPGTTIAVTDVEDVLVSETATTGSSTDTTQLNNGSIDANPVVAEVVIDSDDDTVSDTSDNCPFDANGDQLDTDSDDQGNVCDDDDDGDSVADTDDAFPLDPTESVDTDADGTGNNTDTDDDGDGVLDEADAFPLDSSETTDTDGDGIGNNSDTDDDGDGVADEADAFPLDSSETVDTDSDGTGNNTDTDDDGDGVLDEADAFPLDNSETTDTDGDGIGNNTDTDDDGDGVSDEADAFPLDSSETSDTDGDGTGDNSDDDIDGDTVANDIDNCPLIANLDQADADQDNVGDACETDNPAVWDQTNWDNSNWQ